MSKSDFGRSFNTFRKRVEEKPLSLTRLGRRRGCRGRLEGGDEGGVLTLLRQLKAGVVVTLLQVLLPVAVERVDDALRVLRPSVDDVARLLLRFVGGG